MRKQLNDRKYKRRMDKMLDLLEKQNELFLKLTNELPVLQAEVNRLKSKLLLLKGEEE
jgi:hypothetical protein